MRSPTQRVPNIAEPTRTLVAPKAIAVTAASIGVKVSA